MKKIIITLLITVTVFTLGLSAYSKYGSAKTDKTEEKTVAAINKAFKNKDMEKVLRKNGLYEDEIKRNMTDYLRCVVNYNMSEEANNILLEEAENGKDLDKLLKIYQFLFMANADFSLIDDMYSYGERSNFKNAYWLEDAYNEATNKAGGVLNEEEITEYINKGLDYEDITVANTLCFRGVKTIKEILDERVKKKDWIDIIASIYPEANINKSNFKDVEPYEIIDYIKDSLAHNENINEMYDKRAKKISEKFEKKQEKRMKLLSDEIIEKNMFFVFDDSMKKYAKSKLKDLSDEEIEALINDGFLIREIERGIKLSRQKGVSVKEAIDKDFKGGRNK